MNITDETAQRRELGVERFVEGHESLAYEGVVFWKDRDGHLVVASYSEFVHPENSSVAEAADKIERSKKVIAALSSESSAFRHAAGSLPHKYEFYFDYGKGAVLLARLEDERVVWCGK